jgi:preprotein translocase subunit SecB
VGTPTPPDAGATRHPGPLVDQDKEPGITLAQVYLDVVEFSHRADALSLPSNTKPEVGTLNVALEVAVSTDERAGYVKLTAATDPATQPIYNVKLTMIGLVTVGTEPNLSIRDYLIGSAVPTIYPFIREAFANITQRGRFGPVWLNPINTRRISEQLRGQGLRDRSSEPSEGFADRSIEPGERSDASAERETAGSAPQPGTPEPNRPAHERPRSTTQPAGRASTVHERDDVPVTPRPPIPRRQKRAR